MRVIPGTQNMQLHEMKRHTEEANVLSSRLDPELVEEDRAVDIVVLAGGVSAPSQYRARLQRQYVGQETLWFDHPLHSYDDSDCQ